MQYRFDAPSLPFFSTAYRGIDSTELRRDQVLWVGFTLDKKRLGLPTTKTEERCLTLAIEELQSLATLMQEYSINSKNDLDLFRLAIGLANLIHSFNHHGGHVPVPTQMFGSIAELKAWAGTSSDWLEEIVRLIETCRLPVCPTANYHPAVLFFVAWTEQMSEAEEDLRRGLAA